MREALQVHHLAIAGNVNAHRSGFEPPAEAKRYLNHIRRLSTKFGRVVEDVMGAPARCVHPDEPLESPLPLVTGYGLRDVLVTNAEGCAVGLLEKYDLFALIKNEDSILHPKRPGPGTHQHQAPAGDRAGCHARGDPAAQGQASLPY